MEVAANKTVPTGEDVGAFVESIDDPTRQGEARTLVEVMSEVTGEPADALVFENRRLVPRLRDNGFTDCVANETRVRKEQLSDVSRRHRCRSHGPRVGR